MRKVKVKSRNGNVYPGWVIFEDPFSKNCIVQVEGKEKGIYFSRQEVIKPQNIWEVSHVSK